MIPSIIAFINTRINYDMLNYLPKDMDTSIGQNILLKDFGKGAFSLIIVEGMDDKQVNQLKEKLEKVDNVDTVLWYSSFMDLSVPKEILPQKYYDAFNSGDATMMAVFFNTSTSSDETMEAIKQIRKISGKECAITGMSALVTDLKELCEKEEPLYVGLAVLLACVTMMIFMDSWIIPIIFLISIGFAIILNMGTNYFMGEISYLTKALSAVLQLAVTMDYSIFLWHSYTEQKVRFQGDKERAMAHAIKATISSVLGSSITTIAGFIALCFMSFTLGKDLGIVMAKGVAFGVIGCITTLPALILVFDKLIERTKHKSLIPGMNKLSAFIVRHTWVFLILFVVMIVPAYIGYKGTNNNVYYDFADSLPKDMDYIIANTKLQEKFNTGSTHMLLLDAKLPPKEVKSMLSSMEEVDGVKAVISLESVVGSLVPEEILPKSVLKVLKSDKWELVLINSIYKTASDEVNKQITDLNSILKSYDPNGMLIGEASCTKDMIDVTDQDFKIVNLISIIAIFVIIALVLYSISLPFILVIVIEFAIFINLGLSYYTGTSLPFIAPICISTIQLGATVDYAILLTTRYKKERSSGQDKHMSITTALTASIPSIIVSALGFFAATFGVKLYSDVDIISSLCDLMSRGALISMLAVIFVLPAMLMLFDKIICTTTIGINKRIN
jgi:predicted RND superfamily exporter protein